MNGCFSKCGTDIVNNDLISAGFMKVGYFEVWDNNRPCPHMALSGLRGHPAKYTHVYFSFGETTDDCRVDISSLRKSLTNL
jgi:hypothetical protein